MYADPPVADLAIVVVSTNEAHWLGPCLQTIYDHAGEATLEVIVVDNESTDGTRDQVESRFPEARVVDSVNRGFGHGNNRGIEAANARYVLLLNPDTEIVEGTFGELVAILDARPEIGLAGVRQRTGDGELTPTMRRFPSISRALGEALRSESWPAHPSWAGERVLDLAMYASEQECDWTSGSFMLARREALLSAGLLDERMFIYCEEPDLCLRVKRAGWKVLHLPQMTIIHHADKGGVRPRMIAQDAYARHQYATKHFGGFYGRAYMAAVALRHLVRLAAARFTGDEREARGEAAARALRTLAGREQPPFGTPPATALTPVAPASDTLARSGVGR